MGYAPDPSRQQSAATIDLVSQASYTSKKNELLTLLQQYGSTKTYEEYAEMLGISRRQVKNWRRYLMDELDRYLPKPRDRYARLGYRRPKINSKGAVLISSLATQRLRVTIPKNAILDIDYVENNDDTAIPYKGSQIILTFNGEIGSSRDTGADDDEIDDEIDDITEQAAELSGDFALP